MAITSIYLDTELPAIPGLLNLRDFLVYNFFEGMPAIPNGTIPIAGFYWGPEQPNIADNGYSPENPGVIHGTLENPNGYIEVNRDNYLDTKVGASLTEFSWAAGIYRPAVTPTQSIWYFSNFQGAGVGASGWAVGVGNNGRLRVGYQVVGGNFQGFDLEWPASITPGSKCAISGIVWNNRLTIAIYDPLTDNYVSTGGGVVPRSFGRDFLVGAKYDSNLVADTLKAYAFLVFPADIAGEGHRIVQRHLYNMVT